MTQIARSLVVLEGDKIQIPGCEPATALTSAGLLRSWNCQNAIVDLKAALAAIPGSTVVTFDNMPFRKYFRLPPVDVACPCESVPDYFEILRSISTIPEPKNDEFSYCDIIDNSYCPSPDFDLMSEPPTSTYQPEGTTPYTLHI